MKKQPAATASDAVTATTAASSTASRPTPATAGMLPAETIVIPNYRTTRGSVPPPPDDTHQRAIHRIRLSALQHNFAAVESAASRQRCSVIVVVKADGYGHGAIATALHLADRCGADAFAVATLQEAILLRKAFDNNPPGRWSQNLRSHFYTASMTEISEAPGGIGTSKATPEAVAAARAIRPSRIRILVLGPPVGFPRCFDDYYHHGIEVMVSGPEVAKSLMEWLSNDGERKRTQVERAAMETKAAALLQQPQRELVHAKTKPIEETNGDKGKPLTPPTSGSSSAVSPKPTDASVISAEAVTRKSLPHPSSTLGNVSGQDLAKEVRALLMNQKAATDAASLNTTHPAPPSKRSSGEALSSDSSLSDDVKTSVKPPVAPTSSAPPAAQIFGGIEAAAKDSRHREVATAKATQVVHSNSNTAAAPAPGAARKRLRWHALVDSGMGRLGFKTEPPAVSEDDEEDGERDTVEILKELVDVEIHGNGPVEFFGMCTHMADASSPTSGYTDSQISKFVSLLQRVRAAGINVPTVSTDNSAALLTTNLTHFNPDVILTQPGFQPTRGYVRTGGAIYGQRPAFKQLRAVSTLLASVRHVAVLREGESVGYDRAYIAPRDVRIATLTIGFADGYPRELGNGVGKVAIRGTLFPVAGNVCMDMLMVELGPAEDKEGEGAKVVVGDVAVLWGPLDEDDDEGLVRLQDLAATLKTTQSALTCGLDKIRVLRQFS